MAGSHVRNRNRGDWIHQGVGNSSAHFLTSNKLIKRKTKKFQPVRQTVHVNTHPAGHTRRRHITEYLYSSTGTQPFTQRKAQCCGSVQGLVCTRSRALVMHGVSKKTAKERGKAQLTICTTKPITWDSQFMKIGWRPSLPREIIQLVYRQYNEGLTR